MVNVQAKIKREEAEAAALMKKQKHHGTQAPKAGNKTLESELSDPTIKTLLILVCKTIIFTFGKRSSLNLTVTNLLLMGFAQVSTIYVSKY